MTVLTPTQFFWQSLLAGQNSLGIAASAGLIVTDETWYDFAEQTENLKTSLAKSGLGEDPLDDFSMHIGRIPVLLHRGNASQTNDPLRKIGQILAQIGPEVYAQALGRAGIRFVDSPQDADRKSIRTKEQSVSETLWIEIKMEQPELHEALVEQSKGDARFVKQNMAKALSSIIVSSRMEGEGTFIPLALDLLILGTSRNDLSFAEELHYVASQHPQLFKESHREAIGDIRAKGESLSLLMKTLKELEADPLEPAGAKEEENSLHLKEPNPPYDYHTFKREEIRELGRLHLLFVESGGRLLIDPEASIGDIIAHIASGEPVITLGAGILFDSPLWGSIALDRLVQAPKGYEGNIGQVELFRDLSVVFNRHRLRINGTKKYWGEQKQANQMFKGLGWNEIGTSWTKYLWLNRNVDWSQFRLEAGYDRFSIRFCDGNSPKAWQIARTLLTPKQFAQLGWKKTKFSNVKEQARLRRLLLEGIESGRYLAEKGYDQFAVDEFQGNSLKGWNMASSILAPDEFTKLEWPGVKYTNVSEQDRLRETLLEEIEGVDGIKRLRYEEGEGYNQFSTDFFNGNPEKAWKVASSLLTKEQFARLKWKGMKRTPVKEQDLVRTILLEGIKSGRYVGNEGYNQYAIDFYGGNSPMAWQVARSLLTEKQFKKLKWRRVKYTHVSDEPGRREALLKGIENGYYRLEAGYDRFSRDFFLGDTNKAWNVAKSLLTPGQFRKLGWGKNKRTKLEL